MNLHAVRADLHVRDGPHLAHVDAKHRLPGDFDVTVFRRFRRRDRLTHCRGRRHELRRIHRTGPDHVIAADTEHLECVVRDLLSRFTGTIYELLSAPVSSLEIVLGYVGAAATKSIILGFIILATARFFVPLHIAHPFWMIMFLVLTAVTFSLFGFIIGIWADGFEKLQVVPLLIVTPLTFLGGSFYSMDMLPPFWQTVTLFNPVVYLVSGFRWSFYEIADVSVGVSLGMTIAFLACHWPSWLGSSRRDTGSRLIGQRTTGRGAHEAQHSTPDDRSAKRLLRSPNGVPPGGRSDCRVLVPALPVAGAHADMERLARFIREGADSVTDMSVTLDSHHRLDIAHPTSGRPPKVVR